MTVWTFAIVLASFILYGLLMFYGGYRHAQVMEHWRRTGVGPRSVAPPIARHPRVDRVREQLRRRRGHDA